MDPQINTSVSVRYPLSWLKQVMEQSISSQVPFACFSAGRLVQQRLYPRSSAAPFVLGGKGEKRDAPHAGGRYNLSDMQVGSLFGLCELLEQPRARVPLADIAIASKRAMVRQLEQMRCSYSHLELDLGPSRPAVTTGLGPYLYPLVVISGKSDPTKFPRNQVDWRIVQCVFAAKLTANIRRSKIGIEVVSREGFGSLFPTVADLPNGIRLDPGLLPTDLGSEAIANAMEFADAFIQSMITRKAQTGSQQALNGMTNDALLAVDRLLSDLHQLEESSKEAKPEQYVDRVLNHRGRACDINFAEISGEVNFRIACEFPVQRPLYLPHVRSQQSNDDDEGYGSDSEYEEAIEQTPLFGRRRSRAVMRKYSVISGMAALRIAAFYGMKYSHFCLKDAGGELSTAVINRWAPYFEFDLNFNELREDVGNSFKDGPTLAGMRVLMLDGAPNPINIPQTPIPVSSPPDYFVIVVDTTNNTSREKAKFIAEAEHHLIRSTNGGPDGIVILVDSGSKHPTGGDLVHGVIRVCGSKASVKAFHKVLQRQIAGKGGKVPAAERLGLTVLEGRETGLRRRMIDGRIIMRNADVFSVAVGGMVGGD